MKIPTFFKTTKGNFFGFQIQIKKITLWFKHIAFLQPAVKALKKEHFCP